jgi:DNA-binding MarR family transcriptional regulator
MLGRSREGAAALSNHEDALPLKLDGYLPYRLSVTSNAVSRVIARAYEDRFGLSIPEWRLIAVLGEGATMTQTDIVARTAMDKMTVSRAAAGLLAKGHAMRTAHGEDRRSHHLALSESGRAVYREIVPLALRYEAQVTAGLTTDEITTLLDLLDRLKDASESR